MLALILVPFVVLWTAGNQEFLERARGGDWEYVGYTERAPGPQADGAVALTLEVEGTSFILFKQKPADDGTRVAEDGGR